MVEGEAGGLEDGPDVLQGLTRLSLNATGDQVEGGRNEADLQKQILGPEKMIRFDVAIRLNRVGACLDIMDTMGSNNARTNEMAALRGPCLVCFYDTLLLTFSSETNHICSPQIGFVKS